MRSILTRNGNTRFRLEKPAGVRTTHHSPSSSATMTTTTVVWDFRSTVKGVEIFLLCLAKGITQNNKQSEATELTGSRCEFLEFCTGLPSLIRGVRSPHTAGRIYATSDINMRVITWRNRNGVFEDVSLKWTQLWPGPGSERPRFGLCNRHDVVG